MSDGRGLLSTHSLRNLGLHIGAARTAVVGICGAQGTGKSTIADFLKLLLKCRD